MEKLIIVLTNSSNDWGELKSSDRFPSDPGLRVDIDCESGKIASSPQESGRVLTLIKIRGSMSTDDLERVKGTINDYSSNYNILLATHNSSRSRSEIRIDQANLASDINHIHVATLNDPGYRQLIEELSEINPDTNDIPEHFDNAFEEIQKRDLISIFGVLKHRISHLFLPVETDIQGLEDVSTFQNQQEYAEEIIKEYRKSGYGFLQLLANLQFMVVKQVEVPVSKSITEEALPDKMCISDVFDDANLSEDSTFLKLLISHCRISHEPYLDQGDDLAEGDVLIDGFLSALDMAVRKESPKYFLDVVKDGKDTGGFNGESFCRWFAALDRLLDTLRCEMREKLEAA